MVQCPRGPAVSISRHLSRSNIFGHLSSPVSSSQGRTRLPRRAGRHREHGAAAGRSCQPGPGTSISVNTYTRHRVRGSCLRSNKICLVCKMCGGSVSITPAALSPRLRRRRPGRAGILISGLGCVVQQLAAGAKDVGSPPRKAPSSPGRLLQPSLIPRVTTLPARGTININHLAMLLTFYLY